MDAIPTFLATTSAKSFYRLQNRFWLIAGEIIIDIDDQQRRALAQAGFLTETGERENLFVALRENIVPTRHVMPPSVCALMANVHRDSSVMSSRKKDGLLGWLSENESLITIESARISAGGRR
jgi:hypothetical protein